MTPESVRRVGRPLGIGYALLLLPSLATAVDDGAEFFEKRIRPLLTEKCHSCHGPMKQKASLRLDSLAALLEGGDNGPAVAPGKPEESRLVRAVRYDGELKMPPTGKLRDEQIADLSEWVRRGAPWPSSVQASPGGSALVTGVLHPILTIPHSAFQTSQSKKHWAFQPVRRGELPQVKDADWAANPVDRFIRATLEQMGLTP